MQKGSVMNTICTSRIKGSVVAPPSKSAMIRTVAAALLASGTSKVENPSMCDDAMAALTIARDLGAHTIMKPEHIVVEGTWGLKRGHRRDKTIRCGESGLCMRMFTPIAGLIDEEMIVEGTGSLLKRPMKMVDSLGDVGGRCETTDGFPPIRVKGPIVGGALRLNGSESSQFLTGLLMALPLCREGSTVEVSGLRSRAYVEMTLDVVRQFGIEVSHDGNMEVFTIPGNQRYEPCLCTIEGDWSGAAFMLVAGAIGGIIRVKGLRTDSRQADKAIIGALKESGAKVKLSSDCVSVETNRLMAFEIDATDCPDLFPPLAALAAHCEGKSSIVGVKRLKHKESNRAFSLASEFVKLGIEVQLLEDRMVVRGGRVKGAPITAHNDHRIAMACAVAALRSEGKTVIDNPACVSKSYPSFFDDLASIKEKP